MSSDGQQQRTRQHRDPNLKETQPQKSNSLSPIKRFVTTQSTLLIYWLIAFRIINALLVATFFQPDEYFQSLEPAWQIAFGERSGAWITWEWREQLRSSIHPYMFAAVYKIVHWLSLAMNISGKPLADMLYVAPKLLQAVIAALMDLYTWKFATKHAQPGSEVPTVALLLTLMNPWQWFCSTRTLINSLESTLTAAALYYWPWESFVGLSDDMPGSQVRQVTKCVLLECGDGLTMDSMRKSLTLAALACVLRAPNIIIWISIAVCCVAHMAWFNIRRLAKTLPILLYEAVCCGSAVLAVSAVMDRRYYGEWTVPPLQFLQFNLIQGLAVFYGENRLDYYLTEGLPLLMTTSLPFAMYGIYRSLRLSAATSRKSFPASDRLNILRDMTLVCVVIFTTAALSQIPHKEARFLYPLLPMLNWFAAHGADGASLFHPWLRGRASISRQAQLLAFVVANVVIASYVSLRHQRGVVDVTLFLRKEWTGWHLDAANSRKASAPMSVGFLMPCHSTPWRSHLVFEDLRAWALTCEPPLNMAPNERDQYLDEADWFYKDPPAWLDQNMRERSSIRNSADLSIGERDEQGQWQGRAWPSHLVFFEALEPTLKDYLADTRYQPCWRGFNSDWHDDGRRKGDVVVWCLR